MNISAIEIAIPYAVNVLITDETISVELFDGRTISVPIEWLRSWHILLLKSVIIGNLLAGVKESFKKWLINRKYKPQSKLNN